MAPSTRYPAHVAVAIGLGTGVYAFSLAAVTGLQAATDRALIADREPVADAIALLGDHHDRLAASLEDARTRYVAATEQYGALAGGLDALHQRLDALGESLAAVEAMRFSAAGLSGPIPVVRPRTASGGSSSGSSGSSGSSSGSTTSGGSTSGTTAAVLPPPPAPAAPPPTQATTGASGVP
jgi:hypothetical protein